MSIFLPGLPELPTGLYFLSVDNSQKDKPVYTIGRHLRHSPPEFEMIRGLDIFYSGQPVSVPQGHGRLIDADELMHHRFTSVDGPDDGTTYRVGWNTAIEAIMENAPTVIPAEEGESDG